MTTAVGAYATTATVKARLFAAGVTDTADDTLIGTIVDQVNSFIEGPEGAGRPICPVASATFLIDGDGTCSFYFPRGIRAITDLSVGDYSGASRTTQASTDYFIRPLDQDREPGWPAFWVYLSDLAGLRYFPRGFSTISMTATTGWAAIPDEITNVALTLAVRSWHGRQSGQADIVGNDETGSPVVSRYLNAQDRNLLRKYRRITPPG